MINKDYILRMAERVGRALAIILGLRQANRYQESLIYIDDLAAQSVEAGVRLTFTLPAGSYATVLLREVMKTPVDDATSEDSE